MTNRSSWRCWKNVWGWREPAFSPLRTDRTGWQCSPGCAEVDVVILDVHMPGMDGIEVLREIRRAYPLIEVIMLSGRTTIESAIEGMRLGAFDYLIKPCPADLILAKVREAKAKKQKQEDKITESRARESALRNGH